MSSLSQCLPNRVTLYYIISEDETPLPHAFCIWPYFRLVYRLTTKTAFNGFHLYKGDKKTTAWGMHSH